MASAVVAALVGMPIGILSALKRRNPLIDYPCASSPCLGLSMPVFWLGILLLIVFSLHLNMFPLIGGGDLDGVLAMIGSGEVFTYPGISWPRWGTCSTTWCSLPSALGFTLAATVSRLSRSAMLEVISQDYIRTARAKGQRAAPGGLQACAAQHDGPLLTIIGIFMAIALTGTVLTETVFTRPGLGQDAGGRHRRARLPAGPGAITVFTMIIIVVNLVVDMLYAVVDPRITYR